MRIWVDCTAAPHPLVLRPVIERLQAAGHEVTVTARDYGQTLGILRRLGIPHIAVGRHGGASRARKLAAVLHRSGSLARLGRRKRFDLALAHGSVDLSVVAKALRIPVVQMFDYEFATAQHQVNCRVAKRVLTPEAIPLNRLERFGVDTGKLAQYPGLKEEYYLADFEPDPSVLEQLGLDGDRLRVVVRPPSDVSMYHATNPLYSAVIERLAQEPDVVAVVIPRTKRQAEEIRDLGRPNLLVPPTAIDGPSLIAFADLVISAGGTMNREAVALGTPVYTTFTGRLGAVDERLIADRRLMPLDRVEDIVLRRREGPIGPLVRRDPQVLVDLALR